MSEVNQVAMGVRLTTNGLSTQELVRFYNIALAGGDPRNMPGYEKVRSLFTLNDGTKMHADVLDVFGEIVQERIAGA